MSFHKLLLSTVLIQTFFYLQVTAQVFHFGFHEVLSTDYKCEFLFVSIKDSFENVTELSTPHLPNKTDDDVQSLEFRHGSFSVTFPSVICEKFKNLLYINMEKGFVSKISEKILENCTNLERLSLNVVIEQTLWENFFEHNTKLRILKIFSISLKTLDRSFLATVNETLTDLSLSITSDSFTFPSDFMTTLSNVRSLELNIEKLTDLPATFFENSEKLENLILENCGIRELPKGIFKNLKNLEDLNLSRNRLRVIHSDSFGSHPMLMTVDISGNQLTAIDPKFYQLESLLYIYLPTSCGKSILVDDKFNGTVIRNNSDKCTASYKPRE